MMTQLKTADDTSYVDCVPVGTKLASVKALPAISRMRELGTEGTQGTQGTQARKARKVRRARKPRTACQEQGEIHTFPSGRPYKRAT